MKTAVKKRLIPIIEFIFTALTPLLAFGIRFVPQSKRFEAFKKQGMHLLPIHYYMPVPDDTDIATSRYTTQLVGISIDEQVVVDFLERVINPYKAEFAQFPLEKPDHPNGFFVVNGAYMAIDGNVYYGIIRGLKPKRIIEVGSGYSTILAHKAIKKNTEEGLVPSELVCIEPFPSNLLRSIEQIELIEKRVQDVDLSMFTTLTAGDVLFIDSTHILRIGGDIWWIYTEILPRLNAGVYVHIHDISLPKPYPPVYAENNLYWNEQYVLQTFLAFNARFEILWPGNYMLINHRDRVLDCFQPEYDHMRAKYPQSEATSFWLRVRD